MKEKDIEPGDFMRLARLAGEPVVHDMAVGVLIKKDTGKATPALVAFDDDTNEYKLYVFTPNIAAHRLGVALTKAAGQADILNLTS